MKRIKTFEFYSRRWGDLAGNKDEDIEKMKNTILNLYDIYCEKHGKNIGKIKMKELLEKIISENL